MAFSPSVTGIQESYRTYSAPAKGSAKVVSGQEQAAPVLRQSRPQDPGLTTFLHDPAVDGTNNAAEGALRPAMVIRKITGVSRSEKEAKAWSILGSVIRTAQQQDKPLIATIETLLQAARAGEGPPTLLLSPDLLAEQR